MRWSATTCERIAALDLFRTAQQGEVTKAADQVKAAQEALTESKNNFDAAVREARAQHANHPWPEDITGKIGRHHEDIERREKTLRDWQSNKNRHAKEAERAQSEIFRIIEEIREGDSLYDQGAKEAFPDAWRTVLIGDICEEKVAETASSLNLGTVGAVIDASKDGTLERLLLEQKFPKANLGKLSRAVVAYLQARGIDQQIAAQEEAEAAAQAEDPPQPEQTEKKKEKEKEDAAAAEPEAAAPAAEPVADPVAAPETPEAEAPATTPEATEGDKPEAEPAVVHVFHDADRGWAVTDEKGRLYGHRPARTTARKLVPASANKVNDWAPQGYKPPETAASA